jgi:hypothetical protein
MDSAARYHSHQNKVYIYYPIILAKYYCSTHNPKPQFGTEKGEHKITILFEIKWRRVYICEREKKRDRACRRRKKGKKKQQQHFFSHVDFEFVSRVKFQPAMDVSNLRAGRFPTTTNGRHTS